MGLDRVRKTADRPYRRIFCASATGADYALPSPFVRYVGYRAPRCRVLVLGDQGREGPPRSVCERVSAETSRTWLTP